MWRFSVAMTDWSILTDLIQGIINAAVSVHLSQKLEKSTFRANYRQKTKRMASGNVR
jgi:hypothetical protein